MGIYEREGDGTYEVCKITLGAEPKDYEVYAYLLEHWRQLRFSPSMEAAVLEKRTCNPKRLQRQIEKQLRTVDIGTKAQQALKLQQEQGKTAKKQATRQEREAEQERQFALRREKHRGH